MLKPSTLAILAALVLFSAASSLAQGETIDKLTVELTEPGELASLEVGLINGGVTVIGYDGEVVTIEVQTGQKKVDRVRDRVRGKSAGLKRIPVSSSSIGVEEYNNRIVIETDSWAHPIDLDIRVPRNTSLTLSCVNDGDIVVRDVVGDLEVSNINGAVTLHNIDGSVVANCQNEDLIVTFAGVNPERDMSFSAFNGDLDVTFPSSLNAKVKIMTTMGDIYTDFDVTEIESPERVTRQTKRDEEGRYRVTIDRAFWGTIGGGGPVMEFISFNGDIYIRQD